MKKLIASGMLALLAACGDDSPNSWHQVVVSVRADDAVVRRLARLEAHLFEQGSTKSSVQRFSIGSSAGSTTFPFSFVVAQNAGTRARLELLGFEASGDALTIETKALVEFGAADNITLELRAGCLDNVCESADQSCTLVDALVTECAPIGTPNKEMDGGIQTQGDADARVPDAMVDATPDADSALPGEVLARCPSDNSCAFEEYPCLVSDDKSGYSCRGEYAAWRMPDSSPGAKVAPRYSTVSDEVALDEITGLAWQRNTPATYAGCTGRIGTQTGDSCSHQEAVQYCEQLTLNGQRWRLPSRIELESLLDFTQSAAAIDPTYFSGTAKLAYWTSTADPIGVYAGDFYTVHFEQRVSGSKPPSTALPVRCVRTQRAPNAIPSARFTKSTNYIRDNFTTLQWIDGVSKAQMASLAEAEAFCEQLDEGLRVPSLKESLTLANLTREVAIYPDFFAPTQAMLWTTSTSNTGEPLLYGAALGNGILLRVIKQVSGVETHVRCVR